MPCIDVPAIAVPQLPSPLTLGSPPALLGGVGPIGITLCCKITIPTADLPYPLNNPPTLPPLLSAIPGIETLLNAALGEVTSFLSTLTPDCPLNETP